MTVPRLQPVEQTFVKTIVESSVLSEAMVVKVQGEGVHVGDPN
jgi:hypothetical protein